MDVVEGQQLWSPPQAFSEASNMARFMTWLSEQGIARCEDYMALWQWSVEDQQGFWGALWRYFSVISDTPYKKVMSSKEMRPGITWFEGSRVNFAEHILRYEGHEAAILFMSERQALTSINRNELASAVRRLAAAMRELGIEPGDAVSAVMPNRPETVIAMLATISIGAVWSNAAPEFGVQAISDRLGQIRPKLVFLCDGYEFSGQIYDRTTAFSELVNALTGIEQIVRLDVVGALPSFSVDCPVSHWDRLLERQDPGAAFAFSRVAHDHPLWYVFSSGTTGLPKAIAHSHVGVLLEMLKFMTFHMNLKPGDRSFFYTTTGWVMFNLVVGMMLTGAAIVLYDGNPAYPEPDVLWQLAQTSGATHFGASPTYVQLMEQKGVKPREKYALEDLTTILVGGSPAQPETFAWFYQQVKSDLWVTSQSGGTELASAFVAATPTQPVYAAEIQTRALGMSVKALDEQRRSVIGEVGELICDKPFPSMPLYFVGDPGFERYNDSYFTEIPGVWRHGDFLKINKRGGCYIYGRSDATLNRYGVRIGTAEIYRAVESLPEIADSLIVCVEELEGRFYMPLFVSLVEGIELTDGLAEEIKAVLRSHCSPRHVPDEIHQAAAVPYTLTGKKLEVPVRKLLLGHSPEKVASRGSMKNPEAFDFYVAFAAERLRKQASG